MATALVNAAVGALLAAALLGAAFDARAVAVVVAAALFPTLDAAASLVVPGATNALFHAVWLPLLAGAALYWDATLRPDGESRLRRYGGPHAVRTAWVALASFVVAGIAPALFFGDGAALLYPVEGARYVFEGRLGVSTRDGIVQTFLAFDAAGPGVLPIESVGTAVGDPVATWINPDGRPGLNPGVDREFRLVETGWQLVVVAAAATVLAVRFGRGGVTR